MEFDNVTHCYQGIQRVYRNGCVRRLRQRLTDVYGADATEKVKTPFKKEWQEIIDSANQSRVSGELQAALLDEFDVLGVNHFYGLFELYFDDLFPDFIDLPKKQKNLAKQAILGWSKSIKNLRDPLSHPGESDFTNDDARHMLFCARNILDAFQLFDESQQVVAIQRSLDSLSTAELLIVEIPPADEVVTHFVGRNREILQLRRWIEDNNSPRWALAGDGGKGKSAIAYSFARDIARNGSSRVGAVIWLSAKRRRFIQGQTTVVNRPDFYDKESVIVALLGSYGEIFEEQEGHKDSESALITLLNELPALIVIDDIDTLEGDGLEAIPFLQDLPVRTNSKLLITSRKILFGLESCTTAVSGLSENDANAFISSRCELMGIEPRNVMRHAARLREATDSSPLFIEDLLRLTLAGLGIEQAIGVWQQKRGDPAREYAIQREFDALPDDAKDVLFVLSLMERPCLFDELCSALEWHSNRVLEAQQSLRQIFLMPKLIQQGEEQVRLSLSNNTKILVRQVFATSARYERVQRRVHGVLGQLETTSAENRLVSSKIDVARAQISRALREQSPVGELVTKAINQLNALDIKYPGRSDIPSTIGWLHKKVQRTTDARAAFKRSAELRCSDSQMYWHWSDLEILEEEWDEAIRVAELGRAIASSDPSLLYCLGYAQSRRGRELADNRQGNATPLLKKAESNLLAFVDNDTFAKGNWQKSRALRALVLTSDALSDGKSVLKYLKRWAEYSPGDSTLTTEYERMRIRFPEDIPPAEQILVKQF
jgi:hypothetical protein